VGLGFADGILNALTLAAASLVGDRGAVTFGLALRISIAALVTAGFAVFVGEYAQARGGLRHAARQLNLSSESGLAETRLGRDAMRHAVGQSLLASVASMLGALLPLALAAAVPGPEWIAAVLAIAALGLLGVGLASVVLGSRALWAVALVLGGVAVTLVGTWLHIA
jgi:VIT1/CCC1 family predicted Fe2+/Mn2+ transporter